MKKTKTNLFIKVLSILFFVYISLYIALESGYYETKISKKTSITAESIEKFEQDIKDGKPIDLETYTYNETKDYSNNTTDVAIYLGEKVEKFMSTGISDVFNVIKTLFT